MTATCLASAYCCTPFSNARPMAGFATLAHQRQGPSQTRSNWSGSWGQKQAWPIEMHRRTTTYRNTGQKVSSVWPVSHKKGLSVQCKLQLRARARPRCLYKEVVSSMIITFEDGSSLPFNPRKRPEVKKLLFFLHYPCELPVDDRLGFLMARCEFLLNRHC